MATRQWAGALLLTTVVLGATVLAARAGTWPPVAVVESDSMRPAFSSGDLLVLGRAGEITPGDVVVVPVPAPLRAERGYPERLAHRVVAVQDGRLTTQGDRLGDPDPFQVPAGEVSQRAVAAVPLAGHAVAFLGSPVGMLWLVGGLLLAARLRSRADGEHAPATAADIAALRADLARLTDAGAGLSHAGADLTDAGAGPTDAGVGFPDEGEGQELAEESLTAGSPASRRPSSPPGRTPGTRAPSWAAIAAVRAGDTALWGLDVAREEDPPDADDGSADRSA